MTVKLLTEHHLEFLSLKGGCKGSFESTLVKMPHCWKSHVAAQILILNRRFDSKNNWSDVRFCIVSRKKVNKRCTFFHFGIKYFLRWRIAQGYLLHLRSSFQLLCAYLLNHFSRCWLQFQESRVRSWSGSKPWWRLIMKSFIRSFCSFSWFKKSCC